MEFEISMKKFAEIEFSFNQIKKELANLQNSTADSFS